MTQPVPSAVSWFRSVLAVLPRAAPQAGVPNGKGAPDAGARDFELSFWRAAFSIWY